VEGYVFVKRNPSCISKVYLMGQEEVIVVGLAMTEKHGSDSPDAPITWYAKPVKIQGLDRLSWRHLLEMIS
jgi:hypothetical protein